MVAGLAAVTALVVEAGHRGMLVTGAAGDAGAVRSALGGAVIGIALNAGARGAAGMVAGLAAVAALVVEAGYCGVLVTGAAGDAGAVRSALGSTVIGIALDAGAGGAAGMISRLAAESALAIVAGGDGIGVTGLALFA